MKLSRHGQVDDLFANEQFARLHADNVHVPVAKGGYDVELIVAEQLDRMPHAPFRCGDGLDAERAVDFRLARVVQAADDARHLVGVARDAPDKRVGFVALGAGYQRVREADARLLEDLLVEADSNDRLALKRFAKHGELFDIGFHNRYGVPFFDQFQRKVGSHLAAADNNHFHSDRPPERFFPYFRERNLRISSSSRIGNGRITSSSQSVQPRGAVLKIPCKNGT